jgi:hypothetical protein
LEPKILETEKTEPELISIAKEILDYRINSSSSDMYLDWKVDELEKLEKFAQKPIKHTNGFHGILGEAIFLDLIRSSDIDIQISTGDEDLMGIDFYLGGFPIDVTTDPTSLEKKIDVTRFTTLYLPRYRGQDSVLREIDYYPDNRDFVLRHVTGNHIDRQSYLYDLMTINMGILKALREQIRNNEHDPLLTNGGINNERNLATILKILINSSLWPASKEDSEGPENTSSTLHKITEA